jgi:hypothetical protein
MMPRRARSRRARSVSENVMLNPYTPATFDSLVRGRAARKARLPILRFSSTTGDRSARTETLARRRPGARGVEVGRGYRREWRPDIWYAFRGERCNEFSDWNKAVAGRGDPRPEVVGSPARILYVEQNIDGTVGGSYRSLLFLLRGLDSACVSTDCPFYRQHELLSAYRDAGARRSCSRTPLSSTW